MSQAHTLPFRVLGPLLRSSSSSKISPTHGLLPIYLHQTILGLWISKFAQISILSRLVRRQFARTLEPVTFILPSFHSLHIFISDPLGSLGPSILHRFTPALAIALLIPHYAVQYRFDELRTEPSSHGLSFLTTREFGSFALRDPAT